MARILFYEYNFHCRSSFIGADYNVHCAGQAVARASGRCGKFRKDGAHPVLYLWMGLSRLAEKSGLSKGAAKALKPLSKKLFRTENEAACENLAMNLSCNVIGIGGAATPYAVKAVSELEKDGNRYAQKLLFVINATSIQIIPTTVITLRASAGSIAAADIFLPSLICTAISTIAAVTLYILGHKLWRI